MNVFKAHGAAQAYIADCVTETFSAIRTVRYCAFLYAIRVKTNMRKEEKYGFIIVLYGLSGLNVKFIYFACR